MSARAFPPWLAGVVLLAACGGARDRAAKRAAVASASEVPVASVSALAAVAPACVPVTTELPSLVAVEGLDPPIPDLLEPGGAVMGPFYEKLARLLRGKATDHLRIGVLGDSNMTMDFITGQLRRQLQARYGDAGHGFVALAKPWSHYLHRDVFQDMQFGYVAYAISTKPTMDAYYGFSGIVAESSQQGAITSIGTASPPSTIGLSVGRFDVFYLKHPLYGSFTVRIDGRDVETITTTSPDIGVGHYRVDVEDGPHRADLVAATPRPVRFLGATLERATPGIIVDSLGVGAMNTRCMTRESPAFNEEMLRIRPYDLVVFMTGANDIYQKPDVPGWLEKVIAPYRAADPAMPIVLVTPPDRG